MKISEAIEELQEILKKEGDLEILEEQLEDLDSGESTGLWYSVDPVVRYREEVKVCEGYGDLPDKFISLE